MSNINPSLISSNPFLDLPYRLRYQAFFQGLEEELLIVIKKNLDNLDVEYIDEPQENYFNPAYNRSEIECLIKIDVELIIKIFWQKEGSDNWKLTFDLDSPIPIDINSPDTLFSRLVKSYFPSLKLVYNFLHSPKVTRQPARYKDNLILNQNWIQEHRLEYRGRWVALQNGQLLADGDSVEQVAQKLNNETNNILFTLIV